MESALLVVCHPDRGSFTYAIADKIRSVFLDCGLEVLEHDLYADRFDPVMSLDELKRGLSFDPLVQRYTGELERCGFLAVVHPDWWGQPPAMLKGWIEKVLRSEIAYEYAGADFTEKTRRGLMSEKRSIVFVSTDDTKGSGKTPEDSLLERMWIDRVFAFCGIENAEFHALYDSRGVGSAGRAAWLQTVRTLTEKWLER